MRPLALFLLLLVPGGCESWTTRDERWQPRGPWNGAVRDRLPELYVEFNGIDFGHAHLAETLLRTQEAADVEAARIAVLDFIFRRPPVPPDEPQIAPTFSRMIWEAQKTFHWAHTFHRSLYDLFASDVADRERVYRELLADYLSEPEAITTHRLDLHGRLWSFPESKSFRDRFPAFNSQIWAYHWLQAAAYDVQLSADPRLQRDLFRPVIAHYHAYLRRPPVEWRMMPMMAEAAPEFARRFPEAAAIFDNLHMLHDNLDDILSRPDLYPTHEARRAAMLRILDVYLHRHHEPVERFAEMHEGAHVHPEGPRPPSASEVLRGNASPPPRPRVAITAGANLDHSNLDEHRPLRIEDPYPVAEGEFALEAGIGVAAGHDRGPRALARVELAYGLLPNFQVSVGAFFSSDPHDAEEPERSGDLEISALYNFNQETLWLPAFGLEIALDLPTGVDSTGVDVELKGLVTKSFGRLSLHLNAGYTFLHGEDERERSGRYEIVVGASYPIGAPEHTRTTLVADLFAESAVERGERAVFGGEVGFRYQGSTNVVLDAGIGSEFAGPSERSAFTATAGISWSF